MKTKDEIIALFVQKGILSNKTAQLRRPYNWLSRFDVEAKKIFDEFASNYRSDAEAWFCLCRKIELPICPVCNKAKVKFTGNVKNSAKGYNTTCEHCSANAVQAKKDAIHQTYANKTDEERAATFLKRKQTNKIKYGDENYSLFGSKSFADNLKIKYDDEHFNNKEKRCQTCIDKYGVKSNLLIPEIHTKAVKKSWCDETRQKRKQHCIKEYGVDCRWKLEEVQKDNQRIKKQNISKIEQQYDCTMLGDVVKKYGHGFKSLGLEYIRIGSHVFVQNKDIPIIAKYSSEGTHTNNYTSKLEKDILSYVKTVYDKQICENDTSIVQNENNRYFELDIYLPDIKVAIDINGTYWHSTQFKDKYYHQRKTRCCRNAGIHIIHIFEHFWKTETDKCKKIIDDCISKQFNNIIEIDDDILVGDNLFPIFGNYEILKITEPEKHQVGQFAYYDCGKIYYKNKVK